MYVSMHVSTWGHMYVCIFIYLFESMVWHHHYNFKGTCDEGLFPYHPQISLVSF